jgi:osmotically-inducible protein OsmY
VVPNGTLVGIVSRANLLHAVSALHAHPASASDAEIRVAINDLLHSKGWLTHGSLNPIVKDGVVDLWGWAESEAERRALRVAVEGVAGVREVVDHVGLLAPYLRGT